MTIERLSSYSHVTGLVLMGASNVVALDNLRSGMKRRGSESDFQFRLDTHCNPKNLIRLTRALVNSKISLANAETISGGVRKFTVTRSGGVLWSILPPPRSCFSLTLPQVGGFQRARCGGGATRAVLDAGDRRQIGGKPTRFARTSSTEPSVRFPTISKWEAGWRVRGIRPQRL